MSFKLYGEVNKANLAAIKKREEETGPFIPSFSHSGVYIECFFESYGDWGPTYDFLGVLSSPDCFNYEVSHEFNPKFKEAFLKRLKGYGELRGYDEYNMGNLCYRTREYSSFGTKPEPHQMDYPFKEQE